MEAILGRYVLHYIPQSIEYVQILFPLSRQLVTAEEVRIGNNVKTSENFGWGGPTSLI